MAKVPVRLTKAFRGRPVGEVMQVSVSNARTMEKIKVGQRIESGDAAMPTSENVPQVRKPAAKKVAKKAATKKTTKRAAKKAPAKKAAKSITGTRNRSMRGNTETK